MCSSMSLLRQGGPLYSTVGEQEQTREVIHQVMIFVSIRHVTCVPVLSGSSMYSKVALQHEDPNNLQSAVLDTDTSKFHGPILPSARRL